ncbi:ATP-binding protein [Actinokineospora sp. NBRC 105648]|uniref:ATP-binding protein n=1 Tax=Actinokineospora sp. NBRC 105648 TaxID=3032206 RepID=UPI0024A44D63|nr:ATP-binding protein [Actinokineospora sp. NBRC 105648]GLZ37547.1 hypothetical protein Acsp05_11720 [Actinokineospora sp. NBRC 105648]
MLDPKIDSTTRSIASLSFTVTADCDELAGARHRLTDWLRGQSAPEALVSDIVLAVYEALANAMEHAYSGEPGLVALTVTLREDDAVVSVTDHGRWRDPNRDLGITRGHGLVMIQAMTSRFDLTHTDGRTTLTAYFPR